MNIDLKLRALAERQHGVITRKQAQELGATATTFDDDWNRLIGSR